MSLPEAETWKEAPPPAVAPAWPTLPMSWDCQGTEEALRPEEPPPRLGGPSPLSPPQPKVAARRTARTAREHRMEASSCGARPNPAPITPGCDALHCPMGRKPRGNVELLVALMAAEVDDDDGGEDQDDIL